MDIHACTSQEEGHEGESNLEVKVQMQAASLPPLGNHTRSNAAGFSGKKKKKNSASPK
jgi:hypothetical protein